MAACWAESRAGMMAVCLDISKVDRKAFSKVELKAATKAATKGKILSKSTF